MVPLRLAQASRGVAPLRASLFHPKSQRRWAQVHDLRFLATHREPDRVVEKYKEKLERKAKEEGLKNTDELREAYKEKIVGLRRRAAVSKAKAPESPPNASKSAASSSSLFPPPPPPPSPIAESSASSNAPSAGTSKQPPGVKTLSSYLDIPKILTLPETEISSLWRLRHASSPNSLCATVPVSTYNRVATTARAHPQFILPLPREGAGAEIHFLQWTFPTPETATVLFTHLAEYKLRGEYATPHTTVTHHLDIAGPKGLVLLKGEVLENRGITVDEGKWLLMCLQKFYGGLEGVDQAPKKKLLEQFSQGDGNFKVEELLEEAEKI